MRPPLTPAGHQRLIRDVDKVLSLWAAGQGIDPAVSKVRLRGVLPGEAGVTLELQPVTFRQACAFVLRHHRHHPPPKGFKFAVGVNNGDWGLVGVVVVGRPLARSFDDGWTAEVTRCCTDSTPHVASKLYAAAWRAARAMGYKRVVTYMLKSESGTSAKAAGYRLVGETRGGTWSRAKRPRVDKADTGPKMLWEMTEETA